jgi:hypothetical protein
MRIGVRLALAAYIGYFMYSLLVYFWGHSGLAAQHQLIAHEAELLQNIGELEEIRTDLESSRDLLLFDTEEIRLLARRLGYLEADQVRIIIEGTERRNTRHTLGRVLRELPAIQANLSVFRAVGFAISLICAIAILLFGMKSRDRIIR